jgi:hypothetical protein
MGEQQDIAGVADVLMRGVDPALAGVAGVWATIVRFALYPAAFWSRLRIPRSLAGVVVLAWTSAAALAFSLLADKPPVHVFSAAMVGCALAMKQYDAQHQMRKGRAE